MFLLGSLSTKRSAENVETKACSARNQDDRTNKQEEEELPMSWSAQVFHQPYLNLGILFIMGFKTKINPDLIRASFEHALPKVPAAFSSLPVIDDEHKGKMKWVRTQVDFDKHVIIPTLDECTCSQDKVVEDYIASLSSTRIDMSKPLWEFHILNIRTSQAEATGVFWFHHSFGDGISLISILFALGRKASDPEAAPSFPMPRPRQKKAANSTGFWVWPFWQYLLQLWSILVVAYSAVISLCNLAATLFFLNDTKTPLSRSRGAAFVPRRFVHRTFSLHDLKLVKNEMKATINDVVVGVTQAALSRYLSRRYAEETKAREGEKRKISKFLGNIRLRATVMANIRPSQGILDIGCTTDKNSKSGWGNLVGFIILPIDVTAQHSPLDHVRKAKKVIDLKKHGLEAKISYFAANMISAMFGVKVVSKVVYNLWAHTTTIFSNIPGPIEEVIFFGHEVAYIAPSAYGMPQALVIHFQSYANKMTVVLSVDERSIPDPHQLCDDFEEALNHVKDAITKKGA